MAVDQRQDESTRPNSRTADWVDAVDRARPMLQGAAYLLTDEPVAADRLLDSILARLWARRTTPDSVGPQALRLLVYPRPPGPLPGAETNPGVELRDGRRDGGRPVVARELARLDPRQRNLLVLNAYAGQSEAGCSQLTGTTEAAVREELAAALTTLVAHDPGWKTREVLIEALRASIPYDRRVSRGGLRDVAQGRNLIRRRWTRGMSVVGATVVVALLVAFQLRQPAQAEFGALQSAVTPTPRPTVSPAPSREAPPAPCNTRDASCRTEVLRKWQSGIADVIGSYVDPDRLYRTVYSASDDRLNPPGFWVADGGALALDLFKLDHGPTKISLQIATSGKYAVSCGKTTRTHCVSQRFLDGNRFTLSESTSIKHGLEVQFSPDGTQVITVIATSEGPGQRLDIERGQLIQLVQDTRITLPSR